MANQKRSRCRFSAIIQAGIVLPFTTRRTGRHLKAVA